MRPLLFLLSLGLASLSDAATLVGQQVQPGGKIEIHFPVSKYFQDIAAQAGNPRPETGHAVVTFPAGFDPSRSWPILIVTSTSDFNRTSAMDADWYRGPATAEGWLVLGSDATNPPRIDSTQWRLGLLGAALEAIRKDWPQSARWPVAFAGFSGGSKRSGVIGVMLAKSGSVRVCGFFLSGINEDRLGEAYRIYHPGAGLLEVPVWLSSGSSDSIATPQAHNLVKASLERAGFKRVRLEQFSGGHQLKLSEVRRALQWFR
ncbi:MAG TPA: hypothetical protein VE086_01960, partial [Chthoniobacterales bacterium]|nr:hypothetical protein [Chthoniobacterales bacterium]